MNNSLRCFAVMAALGFSHSGRGVSTKGDEVTFAFELTAPREPGPLYLQFGEVSHDFNRPGGNQVPFLVWPDLARSAPVKLQVGSPAVQP